MIKKICAASDCDKEFLVKMPHSKFCSSRCKSREHKRVIYTERIDNGLCPQCGGVLVTAAPLHKETEPTYCKKCQEYYQDRYIASRDVHDA